MKQLFNYKRFVRWYKGRDKWALVSILIGFIALLWFLIRVIPKPQRAFYPCQRAAFPLATGFIIWIIGMLGSFSLFRKSRRLFHNSRFIAGSLIGLAATSIFLTSLNMQSIKTFAVKLLQVTPERIEFLQPSTPIIEPVSKVSVVQSEKNQSSDITRYDIEAMVREAVELAGGLDELIEDGNSVVLKPNLLTSRTLPYDNMQSVNLRPEANGIDTDYRIIQAMVDIIREINPSGQIILIEGSGVGSTRSNAGIVGWDRVSGLDSRIYLEEICDWQDKNSPELVKVSLPAGKALYTSGAVYNEYYMSRVYYEADVLISLPCLKNHSNTGITGAVKNVGIGATPSPIYGWGPNDPDIPNERWNPDNGINHGTETNRDPLHNWIHDFYLARPVDFVLMDGLQGIEMGPGAHFGSLASCQENMRMVLASHDPVAIDAIESLICGQDPARIKHLSSLHRDGAGNLDPRLIRVVGKEVHEVKKLFRAFDSGSLTAYSDFTAPQPLIRSASLEGNVLHLDITANEDIAKIEVSVDGIKESKVVVDNFYDINFQLSQTPEYLSHIEISVFDQYLNCAKVQLGGTATNPLKKEIPEMKCFPNPAVNNISVELPDIFPNDMQLELIDELNRVVRRIFVDNSRIVNIDISGLNPGIHIIRYQADGQIFIKKFIKAY